MDLLTVSQVGKTEEGRVVLNNISFEQAPRQRLALAGATGSGKTTLLKIIAGFIEPASGAVFFKDEKIKGPNEKLLPGHPQIAYLSQHFELRNHYRVEELLDMAKKVPAKQANLVYEICRIDQLLKRWTHQLSGGEKQRIALARLLVTAPELLLLDEPYSNLDPLHTHTLKNVIEDVCNQTDVTCLLVSHEPQDTLSWADEILILNEGSLVQQASPREIYRNPADEYVAGLFGKYTVLTPGLAKAFADYSDVEMRDIGRFVRPEEIVLMKEGEGVKAMVEKVRFMGAFCEVDASAAGTLLTLLTTATGPSINDVLYLSLSFATKRNS